MQESYSSFVSPLRNQSKRTGEDLESCKKAKPQSLELVDLASDCNPEIKSRIQTNGYLTVSVLEVNKEVPFPDLTPTPKRLSPP